jgi:chromate transporter
VLIEKRRWITHADYVAAHSVAQLLPGPNVFNLAVIIGHRFAGAAGGVAALTGLVIWPFMIMLAAGALYSRYGDLAVVQRALNGVSAVAIGLAIANSIKLSTVLPKHWRPWLFLGLSFTAVGLLRLPLIGVIAVLGPLGMAMAWQDRK